jgi:hypothetical protein
MMPAAQNATWQIRVQNHKFKQAYSPTPQFGNNGLGSGRSHERNTPYDWFRADWAYLRDRLDELHP